LYTSGSISLILSFTSEWISEYWNVKNPEKRTFLRKIPRLYFFIPSSSEREIRRVPICTTKAR
jgi:hypothetical protein